MSKESDAAQEIRRLANQYKAMSELADSIESLGSIRDAAKQADAERVKAEASLASVKLEVADAEKKLQTVQDDAVNILTEANKNAKVAAELTAATAKTKAQAVLDKAEASARTIVEGGSAVEVIAQKVLAKLQTDTEAKRTELDGLTKSAITKQAEVDGLKAEFEAMRAKFG